MRIDSTDATTTNAAVNVASIPQKNNQTESSLNSNNPGVVDDKSQRFNEYEKREMPVGEKVLIEAVEKANKAISTAGRTFEYRIHEKTKEIMIKVIDSETKEVIREIPPEKTLDMVAKMMEMAGLLVDERR